MRSLLSFLMLIACVGCATPASSAPTGNDSGSPSTSRNRASFRVEAVREVANDWFTARLSVVSEGKDPSAVANEVNTAMSDALARAKRVPQVEVESGAYVTQPVYDDGRVVRWRARQELKLESGDVDRLAKLIGELQGESVLLSSIAFSVRRETRKKIEDELIQEALGLFRARATLIAKGMDAKSWSLIEVAVGGSGAVPVRAMMEQDRFTVSRSQAAAPVFESGTSELRMQVSGIVELD